MIDWDRVEALRDDFGDDSFAEIVEMFLQEVEDRFAQAKTSDATELQRDFHFIKGSAANLGFRGLYVACINAEQGPASQENLADMYQLFAESKMTFLAKTPLDFPKVARTG